MLSATTAGKTAFVNQKLPTEIIGIICGFSDFETRTAIRSTCSSVRIYVPLRKVVGFKEYKKLFACYRQSRIVFQELILLDLHHEELSQFQVEYLTGNLLDYELCRIARKVLDHPEAYKRIDLLVGDCYFLTAAAAVGDLELLIRLLQVPLMDPAARCNRAIRFAASYGRLEIVQFLLKDPRVDPSDEDNTAIAWASQKGHLAVVQALLQDPRVDPFDRNYIAIWLASKYRHLAVLQALLQDPRVDPLDRNDITIRLASENGHCAAAQELNY